MRKVAGMCSSLAKAQSRLLIFWAVNSGIFFSASCAMASSSSGPGECPSTLNAQVMLACKCWVSYCSSCHMGR